MLKLPHLWVDSPDRYCLLYTSLMEDLVESFIKKTDFVKGINYFKEMYIHQITDKWGIDISALA